MRDGCSIRYLARAEVSKLLPAAAEQVKWARRAYEALARGGVQMPPKPGVRPREDSFVHAMPAFVVDDDIVALKWIGARAANRTRGIPYISGLIVLNDAETSRPIAVMDAAEITVARTAAASGVCVERFAPRNWRRVAVIGYGEQGQAHARLLLEMNEHARVAVYTRSPPGGSDDERIGFVATAREALVNADVVITAVPLASPRPVVVPELVGEETLVVPIDFDTSVSAAVVNDADLFVVDDMAQFEYYRTLGHFEGWTARALGLGQTLASSELGRRVVCCNLGVAVLDAVFASPILDQALRSDIGVDLRR